MRSSLVLGRVKTLGREEQVERRSSPATMSSQAMASPLGNRGTGRTRFPSVAVLSEFSHSRVQAPTSVEHAPKGACSSEAASQAAKESSGPVAHGGDHQDRQEHEEPGSLPSIFLAVCLGKAKSWN